MCRLPGGVDVSWIIVVSGVAVAFVSGSVMCCLPSKVNLSASLIFGSGMSERIVNFS
jgi:hypothetical protein